MMTVTIKHKEFGTIVRDYVDEIHYNYPNSGFPGVRIAFESPRHPEGGCGCCYFMNEIEEFEAITMGEE